MIASTGFASASDEIWLVLLKRQLLDERKCYYEHIVYVRAFELAGAEVIDGRVHCMDGREYYFTRPKPHLAFALRECEPTVC
jgi:hypothetical protein